MMAEKELLAKISLLKDIKPRQDWVISTRTRILGGVGHTELSPSFAWQIGQLILFFKKPAFAVAAFIILFSGGMFVKLVQQSLPGDALYTLKIAVERTQFSNIELAQKRLDDLKKVAQENNVAKLPSAIQEFRTSSSKVSQDFAKLVENQPEKALQVGKEIVQLQKDKAQIEKALGAKIDDQSSSELENATKILLENEFSDLDSRTLTQGQLILLNDAKNAFVKGDYETALGKVWAISN